jgi:phage baseplate assembly protein gpV
MSDVIANRMRQEAARIMKLIADQRMAVVTSYDQNRFQAKVMILPEMVVTDWAPILTMAVGNGFGIYAAPNIGDQVKLSFIENQRGMPVIEGRVNDQAHPPPAVPAGQIWIMQGADPAGPSIKLSTVSGTPSIAITGEVTITGDVLVNGNSLTTSGNVVVGTGASGSFTTPTGNIVTVQDGIVTNIY